MEASRDQLPLHRALPTDVLGRVAWRHYEQRIVELQAQESAHGGRIDAQWLMELDGRLGIDPGDHTVYATGLVFHDRAEVTCESDVKFVDNEPLHFDGVQEWASAGRASRIGHRFVRPNSSEAFHAPFGGLLELYHFVDTMDLVRDAVTTLQETARVFQRAKNGSYLIQGNLRRTIAQLFERAIQSGACVEVAATRLYRVTYDPSRERPHLDCYDEGDLASHDDMLTSEGVMAKIDYIDEVLLIEAGLEVEDSFSYERDALCLVLDVASGNDNVTERMYVPIVAMLDMNIIASDAPR